MQIPHFVGGEAVHSSQSRAVRNPADLGETVALMAEGDEQLVDRAVRAATDAQKKWRVMPVSERVSYLAEALGSMLDQEKVWAELQTREHGKLLSESLRNVKTSQQSLAYFLDLATTFSWEWEETKNGVRTRLVRQPVGVTAAILPWNSPLSIGFMMVIPALLAGNAVIVKPSTNAPAAVTQVMTHLAQGLPAGVLNVVNGSGKLLGERLVRDPQVRRITFTGSTATGRGLMRVASDRIKNISLELGGNDPAILLEDVVLDDALFDSLVTGVFNATGQICMNVKRIYVHQSKYTQFVEGFAARINQIRVGNGLDPTVHMGPLNNEKQKKIVEDLIADARHRGGRVLPLGEMTPWVQEHEGHFLPPTLVVDVPPDAALVLEEQFGPAIPVLPFSSWEEVRTWANATEYGLCSSLWTPDIERAFHLAKEIEAGVTFVNVHRAGAPGIEQPFGGVKQSGLGRGHGPTALAEATEIQAIMYPQAN